jgi:RHS repeat-associated protein
MTVVSISTSFVFRPYAGTPPPTPFTYDHGNNTGEAAQRGNGNIVNDGLRIYLYDALNRPVQVTSVASGLVIATYRYDALNRRVQKTISNGGITGDVTNGTSNFYYDGQQLIEKRGGGSPNNWGQLYFWGQYIDELLFFTAAAEGGGVTYRVLSDLLYRTTAVVDTSNNIFEAFDCDAYGNTLCYSGPGDDGLWFTDDDVQTNNPVNSTIFTGRRFDIETQLYYYRARIYSPNIGRFLSRDPIGVAGGINLYAYVGNRAVNRLDPMGLFGSSALVLAENAAVQGSMLGGLGGSSDGDDDYFSGDDFTYNLPPDLQGMQTALSQNMSSTYGGDNSSQPDDLPFTNQDYDSDDNSFPPPDPSLSSGDGTYSGSLSLNPNTIYTDSSTCPFSQEAYENAERTISVAGGISSTVQYSPIAGGTVGNNIKYYPSGWAGGSRGKVTTAQVGKLADKFGSRVGLIGLGLDVIGAYLKYTSWAHVGANATALYVGSRLGPFGAGAALGYTYIDNIYKPINYPKDGGFLNLIYDTPQGQTTIFYPGLPPPASNSGL